MCLNPRWIYKKGTYKENNYHGNKGDFYEIGTYSKCGSCEQCRAEAANNWVIRNKYEAESQKKKCFITLTYEENPIILVKKDLQDFFKRLRRMFDYHKIGGKIRYFASGEYGEMNYRPHFHAIIYGWEDENAEYLTLNKKNKIVMQSKIIQEAWGLGRTSYQSFSNYEAPYIALYNTAQEDFKRAYKMTLKKVRQMEEYAKTSIRFHEEQKKNLLNELQEIRKTMLEEKKKYMTIKEFNTWSIALGWEEFERQYNKANFYDFNEYIEDKAFVTPTPWVKKLANMGDIQAAKEMAAREEMMKQEPTEEQERIKNQLKLIERRKKEIIEWRDKKTVTEYL